MNKEFIEAVQIFTKSTLGFIPHCTDSEKSFARESAMLNSKIENLLSVLECDEDQLFTDYQLYTETVASRKQLETFAHTVQGQLELILTKSESLLK